MQLSPLKTETARTEARGKALLEKFQKCLNQTDRILHGFMVNIFYQDYFPDNEQSNFQTCYP